MLDVAQSAVDRRQAMLTHNSETLVFDMGSFDGKIFLELDVFEEINDYWKSFPVTKQNQIFDVYRRIKTEHECYTDRTVLTRNLQEQVRDLLNLHEFSHAENWVRFHAKVNLNCGFEVTYVESIDKPGSRDQTYLRDDYIRLLTLSLVMRTMAPVWGEYIFNTKENSGTIFKEFYAFQLLALSQYYDSPEIEKLGLYVKCTTQDDKGRPSSIIGGISSEDFPIWVLSLVVVRKLCVSDIRGIDEKKNLIVGIYKFIMQKIKSQETMYSAMIKEKRFEDMGGDDGNLSKIEGYKIKHDLPPGDQILFEFSLSNPLNVFTRLIPNPTQENLALLKNAFETIKLIHDSQITKAQITILQWVLKPVISPRALLYVNKATIINCLAVAQTVLWINKHPLLALLVTARPKEKGNDFVVVSSDSRGRITKENNEEIQRLYPYTKRTGSKNKPKEDNYVLDTIDTMCDNLTKYNWIATAQDDMVDTLNQGTNSKRLVIPHDIKNQIARLIIELANKKEVK